MCVPVRVLCFHVHPGEKALVSNSYLKETLEPRERVSATGTPLLEGVEMSKLGRLEGRDPSIPYCFLPLVRNAELPCLNPVVRAAVWRAGHKSVICRPAPFPFPRQLKLLLDHGSSGAIPTKERKAPGAVSYCQQAEFSYRYWH